jgi:hypothetical protein
LNDLEAEVFKELCPPNIAFLSWIDALDASSGKPHGEFVSGSSSYVPGALLVADGHIYISGENRGFLGGQALEVWG